MRNLKFIHTLLLLVLALPAVATEPTNDIVELNGRSYYKHLVASGDTIYALSKAYNVSEQQILDCNEGVTPATLKVDSYIYVPYTVAEVSTTVVADKSPFVLHTVKSGDTIYSIARKYKVSVATLESDNPDVDIERIAPGMEIKVRRSERGSVTKAEIAQEQRQRDAEIVLKSNEYRVVAGETVYSLSRRFGMSEEYFMEINSLRSARDLKEGMIVLRSKPVDAAPAVEESVQVAVESAVEAQPVVEATQEEAVEAVEAVDMLEQSVEVDQQSISAMPVPMFECVAEFQKLYTLLMLPFHKDGKVNSTAVDFYRGALLAMEDLSGMGYQIDLSVLDTNGSAEVVEDIVNYEPLFYGANLIIGPVYEDEMSKVLPYAEQENIPIVSPLADLSSMSSPVLFQMHAETSHKYDRLANIFADDREVFVIHTASEDAETKSKIYEFGANNTFTELNYKFNRGSIFHRRNADGTDGAMVNITELMRSKTNKVFVVLASAETDVDRVLTTLSSTKASILGRGGVMGDYVVLGNRRWKQMKSIDKQTFFNNNTIFIVPYHANRGSGAISKFDARYITAYDVLPTMYSYRGYDAMMIFCRKMFEGWEDIGNVVTPLATPYTFTFENGLYVNDHWVLEKYSSNYSIDVE